MTKRSMVLLAPALAAARPFRSASENGAKHAEILAQVQTLRGQIYLQDGAIGQSDLVDGRHQQPLDRESWHLVSLSDNGRVLGCSRIRQLGSSAGFQNLTVRHASVASCSQWAKMVRSSVQSDIDEARKAGFSYLELGGWALAEELRNTTEAFRSVLSTYAWAQVIGGALGITTATHRNHSASILRRLGGSSFRWNGSEIPSYFDKQYGCQMELLRFDSRRPAPKYQSTIDALRDQLSQVPVICAESVTVPAELPYWPARRCTRRLKPIAARAA